MTTAMFDKTHTGYQSWQRFGAELAREQARGMKGVVAISAHWESEVDGAVQGEKRTISDSVSCCAH